MPDRIDRIDTIAPRRRPVFVTRQATSASNSDALITCRICGEPAAIPIVGNARLLCVRHSADVAGSRAYIERQYERATDALCGLMERYDEVLALASPETRARWRRVEAARRAAARDATLVESYAQRLAVARNEGDELSFLILSYEEFGKACAKIEAIYRWYWRALEELI